MQALPPRKHVKVLAAGALLHFRQGSAERGRTRFEALLRNHPKRLDLWSQYIDQVGGRASWAVKSRMDGIRMYWLDLCQQVAAAV
jgi:hypothetical protein